MKMFSMNMKSFRFLARIVREEKEMKAFKQEREKSNHPCEDDMILYTGEHKQHTHMHTPIHAPPTAKQKLSED